MSQHDPTETGPAGEVAAEDTRRPPTFWKKIRRLLGSLLGTLCLACLYGPHAAVQRELLHWGETPDREGNERPLRWIGANAIVAAWTPAMAGLVLLLLSVVGGNGPILGWLAVLTVLYAVIVMGFDARWIAALVIALVVAIVFLVVALILKDQTSDHWLIRSFLWLVFDTGIEFYPRPTAAISLVVMLLVLGDCVGQLVRRNFMDKNHYNMIDIDGSWRTLSRDQYTPQESVPDLFEHATTTVCRLEFASATPGVPVVEERVPLGKKVAAALKRRAASTEVRVTN